MKNIAKYNAYTPAKSWSDWIDNFFNTSLSNVIGADDSFSNPAVNVVEAEKDFRIEVAAPGLDKKDFAVKVENDMLTISAERQIQDEVKEGNYTRREFNYTSFKRSFTLPENINSANITAIYENGVLNVYLPKTGIVKEKPMNIEIQG